MSFFVLFLTTTCSIATPLESALEVVICKPESALEAESGLIIFTMTNRGDAPIYVFAPATPFASTNDRPNTDVFDVVDASKKKATYIGLYVSFVIDERAYIKMNPGEALSKRVDLSKAYDLSVGGPFDVTFRQETLGDPTDERLYESKYVREHNVIGAGINGASSSPNKKTLSTSNKLVMWINKSLLIDAHPAKGIKAGIFDDSEVKVCEASKQDIINTAFWRATALTGYATQHLAEIKYSDLVFDGTDDSGMPIAVFYPKLKEDFLRNNWFGEYDDNWLPFTDPKYLETDNFYPTKIANAIYERLRSREMSFDCSCPAEWGATPFTAAVTLRNQEIGICDPFFTLEDTGFVTKAGVLIHEAAHFSDDLAPGAIDYQNDYGPSKAAELARTNKLGAMKKADNYKYFVEGNSL